MSGPAADAGLSTLCLLVLNVKPLRSRIERKIMGGTSALSVRYSSGPLAAPSGAPVAVAVGERVVRVTGSDEVASAGWRSLLPELREPGWLPLAFPRSDAGPALCRLAEEYKCRAGPYRPEHR